MNAVILELPMAPARPTPTKRDNVEEKNTITDGCSIATRSKAIQSGWDWMDPT